ncbi:hypothetical protein ACFX13_029341 [Malus domestica]
MASSTSSPIQPDFVPSHPANSFPNFASMNPNFSNSSSISSISSITVQNISCMVPTKLKRDNYLVWKALFAPIFRRYKLTGKVDGSEVYPPSYVLDASGHNIPNPAFEIWYEKDQNILIWLNSTLSEDIIPFTVGVTSARDLWLNLEHRFGGVSAAHIHQLRSRLHSVHKGDLSISDYLQKIKGLTDSLMAAGAPVSDHDLIVVTLNGLPDEYESFIDSIMLRLSTTTLDDLHGLLLNKEVFMLRKKKSVNSSASEPFQAFATQSQPPLLPTPQFYNFPQAYAAHQSFSNPPPKFSNNNRGRGSFQRRGNAKNFNASRGHFSNSGGPHGNYRNNYVNRNTSGGNRNSFGGRTSCQICNSFDHEALDCYERMNPAFAGRIPPAKLAAMCAHTGSKQSPTPWLMDSGATSHITNDISAIQSPHPYSGEDKVYIGDGQGMAIHHTGNSTVSTPLANFRLSNILHVPLMKFNLLSAYQFLKDNHCSLTLDSDGSEIKHRSSGRMLFRGPVKEGFYPFQGLSNVSAPHSALFSTKASLQTWHKRLGHPSSAMFRRILNKHSLAHSGDKLVSFFCTNCAIGKNHKLSFSSSTSSISTSLELLHCDVWGPSSISSVSGYRFYLLIVDEFTKYTWLFPMKYKSEVFSLFVSFKAYVENMTGNTIKVLRSDSGGEFTSSQFNSFLSRYGIFHQYSCPHTPEQNGCVERKHRHLTETARTLLASSRVPHQFWVEAFSTALYLINRLPISQLDRSPWELLFRKSPDYSRLKVFGCSCYPWLKPYTSSKLDGKSTHCVFLGYSLQHKGYRCLDIQTQRIYISRHVLFNEGHFPFHDAQHIQPSSMPQGSDSPSPPFTLPFPISSHAPASSTASPVPSSSPVSSMPSSSQPSPPPSSLHLPSRSSSQPHIPTNSHPMLTRSKVGIFKPKALSATKHPIAMENFVPTTYLQASKHAHWNQAMLEEFQALQSTGTWSLVPSSPHQNIVGCKWVFRIKRKPDGTVDRYKARLVAKGFHQQEGIDFKETFSPVAKPVTIRILLTLAVQHDWFLNQLDISNAFLHGLLKDEVFMQQPPGFVDASQPSSVCKLHMSLYGLKQATRAWYDKLGHALLSLGFTNSKSDCSLFVNTSPYLVIVLVYVDDIIVTGPHTSSCQAFIHKLSSMFPVKDLGPLHYFLGLEVHRSSEGIFLSQGKYAMDLLLKTTMEGCKPCATPLGTTKLDHLGTLLSDPKEYRSIVGALQYLTWTRPDISFAVNQVCQFLHCPRDTHFQAVKRILRFLKGTVDHGIWFKKGSLHLTAFSDADWAGCVFYRRSTSGYCVYLGSNLISWSAKKQQTVARSSTEAEYRSLALTAAEITWICKIFKDLTFPLSHPPTLWCDNVSAISLASNHVFHARTKHIEIDYHYIRELVLAGLITVLYVNTEHQIADIHTKSLPKSRFHFLRSKLSLGAPPISLRGCKEISYS